VGNLGVRNATHVSTPEEDANLFSQDTDLTGWSYKINTSQLHPPAWADRCCWNKMLLSKLLT